MYMLHCISSTFGWVRDSQWCLLLPKSQFSHSVVGESCWSLSSGGQHKPSPSRGSCQGSPALELQWSRVNASAPWPAALAGCPVRAQLHPRLTQVRVCKSTIYSTTRCRLHVRVTVTQLTNQWDPKILCLQWEASSKSICNYSESGWESSIHKTLYHNIHDWLTFYVWSSKRIAPFVILKETTNGLLSNYLKFQVSWIWRQVDVTF